MKFNIIFNWYGELHTFPITNSSEKGAIKEAVKKLALKLQITRYAVRQHVYSGNKITVENLKE